MRLLRYRPRSISEARSRLRSLGLADQEVDKAISTAEAAGLLDDELFTKVWVEDRLLHHPLSRRAIAQELADKGIDKAIANAALEKLYPAEKEKEFALKLAKVRLARYLSLDREKRLQRTISFLTRRGFSFSLAKNIVQSLVRGSND